ncbi:MAG: hypothetical protein M1831_003690 [Alyxoria varia]|nr:MAG: hypothetical protein M1831_003690 [Alyxoria varia]
MLNGREWSLFAWHKKGLRVSAAKPQGEQRGSYFLQLPYRFAIPVLAMSGVLHLLVSQCIFLVALERYSAMGHGQLQPVSSACENGSNFARNNHQCIKGEVYITAGWSPVAVICFIAVAVLVVLYGVIIGMQRYKPGMPPAAGSSAVIAAACHPNREFEHHADEDNIEKTEKTDVEEQQRMPLSQSKLRWGVTGMYEDQTVNAEHEVQHCSFSKWDVPLPEENVVYA